MMNRIAAAVLAAVLAPAVALYGWGHEGHRIVADIAQERLTEVTKRNVQSLIGNNTLASVANWADQIRPERDETYNWHFVDCPDLSRLNSQLNAELLDAFPLGIC